MNGIMGSILTQHLIPDSTNLFIVSKILEAGGVPGSIIRLNFSSTVVIDQTIKQSSEYLLNRSRSRSINDDLVKM